MANILKIESTAREIVQALDEADGVVTPEVDELFRLLENQGMAAIAPLCDVKDEIEARMAARKAKAAELNALAKKDAEMIANAKQYIMAVMRAMKKDHFSIGALSVTLSKGKESIEIFDEAMVPIQYKVATIKVEAAQLSAIEAVFGKEFMGEPKLEASKTLIKAAITDNVGVAGTEKVRNPYLIIRG